MSRAFIGALNKESLYWMTMLIFVQLDPGLQTLEHWSDFGFCFSNPNVESWPFLCVDGISRALEYLC